MAPTCGLGLELLHTCLVFPGPALTWGLFFPWQKAGAQKEQPGLTNLLQAYAHITPTTFHWPTLKSSSVNLQTHQKAMAKVCGHDTTAGRDQLTIFVLHCTTKTRFLRLPKMATLPAAVLSLTTELFYLLLSSPNSTAPPFQKQLLPPHAALLKAFRQAGKLRNPTCI